MEFKSKTGANIVINVAPFEDALALNNAVGNPVLGLKIDIEPNFDLENAAQLHYVTVVSTQAGVQALIMKCLKRCTYNGHSIVQTTFDKPEAREDYFEVAIACLKENMAPFVSSLFSQFSALSEAYQAKRADIQK